DGIRDFHVTGVQTCALPILIGGIRPDITAPLADPNRSSRGNSPPQVGVTPPLHRGGSALAGPVGGHVGAGGAALGAEPAAVVRRGVEIDVAAPLVGAHPEPGAAVPAEPHRQAPA